MFVSVGSIRPKNESIVFQIYSQGVPLRIEIDLEHGSGNTPIDERFHPRFIPQQLQSMAEPIQNPDLPGYLYLTTIRLDHGSSIQPSGEINIITQSNEKLLKHIWREGDGAEILPNSVYPNADTSGRIQCMIIPTLATCPINARESILQNVMTALYCQNN